MKLRLRGSPFLKDYDFDRIPDADNAAVGKYDRSIAAGLLPAAFLFLQVGATLAEIPYLQNNNLRRRKNERKF